MHLTALEESLIAHAETLIGAAFPDAEKLWISAAARWQVLGARSGLGERERGSCANMFASMEHAQGEARAA
ncbi:hypothetical protein E2P73_23240 [Xanthomonas perforans]|uniref:Uncharacterized protein n=1 Tax=Xanthomonas perforans TaxID=442694 RepID=A0A6L9VGH0_XANPE|nr:hypothetical protein [Xanthomonas perforans]MBZ2604878.1 hypothetical protein [Xanthomonas perforans]MBZ2746635.1 hypothetical protein [Xanthomonas perforans]MBZ3075053.1 hypothetical protein [Xanthomonas perforans]MBZ3144412.1 hypothetical protein [Xanthomonas perforans]MBZ3153080.1 hypothetical protein [Xanthomonas perforans]